MVMKPEYKTSQILKKSNDYLMNLANPALKSMLRHYLPWLKVINLRRLLHEDFIKTMWLDFSKSDQFNLYYHLKIALDMFPIWTKNYLVALYNEQL